MKCSCTHCGKRTVRIHPILDIALCANCQRQRPEIYQYITKTRATEVYRLRSSDLNTLRAHEVDNPHYKKAAPMQLYLLTQIKSIALSKYGSDEPYIVGLKKFDPQRLELFATRPERLSQLTPEQFQYLIANRLDEWGLDVTLTGNVNARDGGIDILAVPRHGFPFLLAVQVKHHRQPTRRTGAPVVRDFAGVIGAQQARISVGMIITNTAFTADASWFAENQTAIVRLRDQQALCRWLKNDFSNEAEYRDIPREIAIGPNLTIQTPVTELWVPR